MQHADNCFYSRNVPETSRKQSGNSVENGLMLREGYRHDLPMYEKARALLEGPGKGPPKSKTTTNYVNGRFLAMDIAKGSVVYFVRAGEFVKIGKTKCMASRITALQNGCPLPIEILAMLDGYTSLEQELHAKFAKYRRHGEWFALSPNIIAYLSKHADTSFARFRSPLVADVLNQKRAISGGRI